MWNVVKLAKQKLNVLIENPHGVFKMSCVVLFLILMAISIISVLISSIGITILHLDIWIGILVSGSSFLFGFLTGANWK